MNFTTKDLEQFQKKGLSEQEVFSQIKIFEKGIAPTNLIAAATIGNGLLSFSKEEENTLKTFYKNNTHDLSIMRFVPASGAASRMFKFLFNFLDSFKFGEETLEDYFKRTNDKEVAFFYENLSLFPFYKQAISQLNEKVKDYEVLTKGDRLYKFIEFILSESGFRFGTSPKGVLPFHAYTSDHILTAFEEHLIEAAACVQDLNVKIHFTISEQHKPLFENLTKEVLERVHKETKKEFELTYSFQKSSTDTIAVTEENKPFRIDDNTILFRPSGHGALIENLNDLDADIIFIKNIDNVVTTSNRAEVVNYKKVLAGLLLKIQQQTFSFLNQIDNDLNDFNEVVVFMTNHLNVKFSDDFKNWSFEDQKAFIVNRLNRPIRVCGMVKNEGQPGGGPFWTKDVNGVISLQIVESAQMDLSEQDQKSIVNKATHFNPVDLVCGLKDYQGNSFELKDFVDKETAFISSKTQSGKALKALELPGLWNGSMAGWNTLFVEVPLITFNPVKTVNDLIKPGHQYGFE